MVQDRWGGVKEQDASQKASIMEDVTRPTPVIFVRSTRYLVWLIEIGIVDVKFPWGDAHDGT